MVVIFERWCELGRSTFRSIYAQFALCFSVVFVVFLGNLSTDPDLFARVAMGRLIDSLGYVPLVDPFAFTPKKIFWIDHEWLSGVVFYFLSQHGGDAALFFGKVFLVGLTVWFLLQATKLLLNDTQPALPWILFCTVSASFVWISTVRCQVFTYLFIAFTLYAFAQYMQRNKAIALLTLPLVMLLWCTLHGGFFVGLGLQGLLCFYLSIDAICQHKRLPWIPGLLA